MLLSHFALISCWFVLGDEPTFHGLVPDLGLNLFCQPNHLLDVILRLIFASADSRLD